jgi:hypothetical protein
MTLWVLYADHYKRWRASKRRSEAANFARAAGAGDAVVMLVQLDRESDYDGELVYHPVCGGTCVANGVITTAHGIDLTEHEYFFTTTGSGLGSKYTPAVLIVEDRENDQIAWRKPTNLKAVGGIHPLRSLKLAGKAVPIVAGDMLDHTKFDDPLALSGLTTHVTQCVVKMVDKDTHACPMYGVTDSTMDGDCGTPLTKGGALHSIHCAGTDSKNFQWSVAISDAIRAAVEGPQGKTGAVGPAPPKPAPVPTKPESDWQRSGRRATRRARNNAAHGYSNNNDQYREPDVNARGEAIKKMVAEAVREATKGVVADAVPEPVREAAAATRACQKCGNTDHPTHQCPKAKCILCGKMGHMAGNCPDVVCINCKEKGHAVRYCPKLRKQSNSLEPPVPARVDSEQQPDNVSE